MSKLLINEPPLEVLPSLAVAIGLNEAIILQQIHYWIIKGMGKEHKGQRWIYNSIPNWQRDNFPFWSEGTIKRTIASLKKQKLITSKNLNKKLYDRTLWYTIDYEQLDKIGDPVIGSKWTDGQDQSDPMDEINMDRPIPETTSENTTENTKDFAANAAPPPPPMQFTNGNHTLNGSSGNSPTPPVPTPPPSPKKEPSQHQQLMKAYQDCLGYKIRNGAADGKAAKQILDEGYTVQQVIDCYQHMKRDPFWQEKHLSLVSIHKQLGAFVQAQNGNGRIDDIEREWQSIKLAAAQPGRPDISERALRAIQLHVPGGWHTFKQQNVNFFDQLKPIFKEAYERVATNQPATT